MKKFGFTLIELLVVMAILGILATVGLGSFRSSQQKGRDAKRKQDLAQVQKALEMYYNDYGAYPDALPAGGGKWEDAKGTLYMKEIPKDSRFGDYPYSPGEGGIDYRLYARLENTNDPCFKPGGNCDIYPVDCGGQNCNYMITSSNLVP